MSLMVASSNTSRRLKDPHRRSKVMGPVGNVRERKAKDAETEALFVAQSFINSISRAMKIIRSELRSFASHEMTIPQFRLLANLSESAATPGELAEILGISPPNITRLALSLIKKNYLTSTRSSRDRRKVSLKLTPKGRVRFLEMKAGAAKNLENRILKLSSESRSTLIEGLKAMDLLSKIDGDSI